MQKVLIESEHDFEAAVKALHDHLYANSNLREPEALHAEVAKVLTVLADLRKGGRAGTKSSSEVAPDLVRDHFAYLHDGDLIEFDDTSIADVVAFLGDVNLASGERDFVGDALEVMRSTSAKRLGGQFFTDQRVTQLAVQLLDYDPRKHDFVDVCAGTGGFLIAAAREARVRGGVHRPVTGTEIDPKIAALADRAMRALDHGSMRVARQDALKPFSRWTTDASTRIQEGQHLRLASNPPFGIKIKVTDSAALKEFELAKRWSRRNGEWVEGQQYVPRPPDLLFIERNLQLAMPGKGRVALVLPYQVLSGPKLGFVREWLLRNAEVQAVVDLPEHTFQPWTGTKTCLVVFQRRLKPLASWDPSASDSKVFMATPKHVGHDRRGKPVFDSSGAILTDLPEVAQAWRAFSKGEDPSDSHPDAFAIPTQEITKANDCRLNASFHHPRPTALRRKLLRSTKKFDAVRLGDVVEAVWCPGRFKRNYTDDATSGVPFLGGANITQFHVTTEKYLRPDDPKLPELVVDPGLVLVTRSGSTGIVSRVPEAWNGWAISEHVIRIRPDDDRLSGDYLEAFLRSPFGRDLLAAGIFGSVIDEITPEYIADLMIPVPKDPSIRDGVALAQKSANEGRQLVARSLAESLSKLDEAFGRQLGA